MIDWIHDHIKEGVRLRKLRTITSDNDGWRGRWIKMKDASQAWILVILTGTTVALVAWLVDVVQEWMSDLKTGYCTTNWRYNSKFCCWGRESGKISLLAYITISIELQSMLTAILEQVALNGEHGLRHLAMQHRLLPITQTWSCTLCWG